MKEINTFLNYSFELGETAHISVKVILIVILVFIFTAFILRIIKKVVTRKLPPEDKLKFTSLFSFSRYFVYLVVVLITFQNMGVQLTAIFTASAVLLVGVGLALQTFFQDIISGIFILIDQTVHAGDIIEIDGKVGRVVQINLRTTRAVTIDNKVLVIPNHKYLTSILYNWTENGKNTRENIKVGVAYGSDVELVKKLLIEAAENHPKVLKRPKPLVLFMDFGESSLDFELLVWINRPEQRGQVQHDLLVEIEQCFREQGIEIPFPQRDLHVKSPVEPDVTGS